MNKYLSILQPIAEAKMLEVKKRTEEATADLRELQYWTEIANTIIKLAQMVGNLTIGGKTGKMIREYTEKRMSETPPRNSTTVTQHYRCIVTGKQIGRAHV